jgi:hypothetical protein
MTGENEREPTLRDVLAAIDSLAESAAKGFVSVDTRFDAVDERFDKLETKVDVLAGHYAELSDNVRKLTDTKVSQIELNGRLRPIEQKLGIPSPQ